MLEFERDGNMLLVGNKNGCVICFYLENYDEKIIPQYQLMSNINLKKKFDIKSCNNLKVSGIKLNSKNEILISFSNGALAVYSHENVNPECKYLFILVILNAHSKEITGMYWNDDKKMLLTVSLDKSIKLHQFPIFWPSEMLRKSSHKNKIHLIIPTEKGIETNENVATIESDLNVDKMNEVDNKLEETRELTEKEINCQDLDGWDYNLI